MDRSRPVAAVAAALIALLAIIQPAADRNPPATQTLHAPVIDPRADRVLRTAADCLAGIKAFRVTNRITVTIHRDGRPHNQESVATLTLQRPNCRSRLPCTCKDASKRNAGR